MLNRFALILIFILLSFSIYNYFKGREEQALILVAFTLLSPLVFILNKVGKHRLAVLLFFIFINSFVFLTSTVIFPGRGIEYVYFLNSMMLLIFFSNQYVISALYTLNILLFYFPQVMWGIYPDENFSYTNPLILFITFYAVTNYFISEYDSYETHIQNQNNRLRALNEEKNQLIGIAAHDLKSPLKRIEGLISLIKMTSDNLTDEQKKLIEHVSKVSEEQNNLILEILDLDKIESGSEHFSLEKINAIPIIDGVIESFKTSASGKNIRIETNFNHKSSTILAIENYFRQVLENLVSNAIKFSPGEKTILIRTASDKSFFHVTIKDEGPGISHEDMPRLFKKFQKLSAQPTGGEVSTGLGLAITKKYVEAMDGNITCESIYGKGAAFTVSLKL